MTALTRRFATPLGPMLAAVDDAGRLLRLDFAGRDGDADDTAPSVSSDAAAPGDGCGEVVRQVEEFFAGRRTAFDLPLAPEGTEFQQRVWAALREIPYGETVGYGELADRIGRPGAARAVGRANATNPIAVVVPCHRVVGADGRLTGYAGGVDRKARLLALEAGER